MERCAVGSLGVLKDFTFEITDYDAVCIMAEDIIGCYGDFATPTRSIDDVLRYSVAGGVTSELFHELKSTFYAGT